MRAGFFACISYCPTVSIYIVYLHDAIHCASLSYAETWLALLCCSTIPCNQASSASVYMELSSFKWNSKDDSSYFPSEFTRM